MRARGIDCRIEDRSDNVEIQVRENGMINENTVEIVLDKNLST